METLLSYPRGWPFSLLFNFLVVSYHFVFSFLFREEVKDHVVTWKKQYLFDCKINANASTGVLESTKVRLSVRKVCLIPIIFFFLLTLSFDLSIDRNQEVVKLVKNWAL